MCSGAYNTQSTAETPQNDLCKARCVSECVVGPGVRELSVIVQEQADLLLLSLLPNPFFLLKAERKRSRSRSLELIV